MGQACATAAVTQEAAVGTSGLWGAALSPFLLGLDGPRVGGGAASSRAPSANVNSSVN